MDTLHGAVWSIVHDYCGSCCMMLEPLFEVVTIHSIMTICRIRFSDEHTGAVRKKPSLLAFVQDDHLKRFPLPAGASFGADAAPVTASYHLEDTV